ncbi:hypothetical protein [Erythrobacter alti]|uniref:hypothetical protein n=1 Tax=Erythrobacter alti TaxID=1896145 RepID=UPI0030F39C1B
MRNLMIKSFAGALVFACVATLGSTSAAAQAAAEEAMILSGSRGTGAAARDMGESVRGSIGGAADAVAATNAAANARRGSSRARTTTSQPRGRSSGYWITNAVDALEYHNVPTYRMNNGAILKVSGTLMATRDAACLRNCMAY